MRLRHSVILAGAFALLVGGSLAVFGESGQGRTPSYGASWDRSLAGAMANDATGVSGVESASVMGTTQSDSTVVSALKSPNVDSLLSPLDLVKAANTFVGEDKFGEGSAPAQPYF